jgi:predicted metallopeptidase
MGRKARVYSKVDEADAIIKGLCEKQPDAMGFVRPETVIVMGIENSERSEKNHTLAKIKPIKGAEKAIFQINNIKVRYVIELYWSDWNAWSMKQKQWILFHELLHVHPDFEKTIKHDCEDFKIILDKVGVDWTNKKDELPNLLDEEVKFNLDLRPGIKDLMEGEDGDEIMDEDDSDEESPKGK